MFPSSRHELVVLLLQNKLLTAVGVLLAAALLLNAAGAGAEAPTAGTPGASSSEPSKAASSPSGEESLPEPDESPSAGTSESPDAHEDPSAASDGEAADQVKAAGPAPVSRTPRPVPTQRVSEVIDGDTVRLANGETVRIAGIDAPERGECHFETATRRMEQLVLGKAVRLGRSDEDRDQYGRLLRYVDVGKVDAGLRLIRSGLATARYDSRDGYGRHPREDRYIAADERTPERTCAPPPEPQPLVAPGGNCAAGYSPCVPSYPPDVDCADVNGPVRVTGSDPHGLDRDRDGVACEG